MSEHEPSIADVLAAIAALRTDLMERLDRQASVIRDEIFAAKKELERLQSHVRTRLGG
jgi:hypothetical protein